MFFNNLPPGGIGGDASPLYASGRASVKVADALAVLFYDRLFAFDTLIALGMSTLVARGRYRENALLWILFACATLTVMVMRTFYGSQEKPTFVVRERLGVSSRSSALPTPVQTGTTLETDGG